MSEVKFVPHYEWELVMGGEHGLRVKYTPEDVPNIFQRCMVSLVFGFHWSRIGK